MSANAGTLTAVVRLVGTLPRPKPGPDVERIATERERLMARYLRDRDSVALDIAMRRLDSQEQAMQERETPDAVPTDVAARYLGELAATWREAEGGPGRALLAQALFERIDVLGFAEATVTLTEHASRHGFGAVLPEEIGIPVSGRGERSQPDTIRVIIHGTSALLAESPGVPIRKQLSGCPTADCAPSVLGLPWC